MTILPRFEKLEDRILLDAEPTATIDGPDAVELGAQDVGFTVTFNNASGDNTPDPNDGDTGFKPFVDVVLPQGADGDDGVTFDSASFLGTPITPVELVFAPDGTVEHPFAVDTNGDPVVVSGTPGDTLLVFNLPYGSFAPNQEPVSIDLTLDFSNLADADVPLTIETRAGFASGNTPFDDPDTDPTIFGPTDTISPQQQVFNLIKVSDLPEEETATGPNFPRFYTLNLDVATGQTLDNVVIEDFLPNSIVYQGLLTVNGVDPSLVEVLEEPTVGVAANNARIAVSIAGQDGTDFLVGQAGVDVSVTFAYFVPEFDANGDAVIDPDSGDDEDFTNISNATADWTPIDPRDAPTQLVDSDGSTVIERDAKSLTTQKSAALVLDPDGVGASPGDTVEFTIDVQVSDFFTFDSVTLEDTLGDGFEFDTSFQPTFTVSENGVTTSGDQLFTPAFNATTGETVITFDLSASLLAAGAADGVLSGDLARDADQTSATTATIVYRANVRAEFINAAGDPAISQGDQLSNDVQVSGDVIDNVTGLPTGSSETDDSSAGVSIPFGQIESKEIVSVNGAAPAATPTLAAGDEVTFSVIYSAPIGAFETLVIEDFMPLPVFDATEVTTFVAGAASATPPAAGTASFGAASAQFLSLGGGVPGVTTVGGSNSLTFDFGTFTAPTPREVLIEVLFTVTVQDVLFGDGLMLTNQASGIEVNSDGTRSISTVIEDFEYTEPVMTITKGAVATNSPDGAFTAATGPSGVVFADPGAAGTPFTGTISSDGLATTPIDANIENLDAGDVVTFAIALENTGKAPGGAFDIRIQDTLPEGFEVPAAGLNLKATTGDGRSLTFTELGGGLFDPAGGIELIDAPTLGAVGAASPTSGANVVVFTYDLVVSQTIEPGDTMTNVASLTQFAAFDGGVDRLPGDDLTDDATADTQVVSVDKSLTSTEFANSESSGNRVLIGEVITYTIVVEVPEGTIDDLTIEDRTRQGGSDPTPGALEILSGEIIGFGSNLTFNGANQSETGLGLGSVATLVDDQLGDGINDGFLFDFGDIVNLADNDGRPGGSDADDQIIIQVTAIANADAATESGDLLTNQARVRYDVTNENGDTRTETVVDNVNVRVQEPSVTIDKTIIDRPILVDANAVLEYQVEIRAATGSNVSAAYDLVFTDLLDDPDLSLNAGTVMLSGSGFTGAVITSGNTLGDTEIRIEVDKLDPGGSIFVTFDASVSPTPTAGDSLVNVADLTFDSLPTDDDPDERDYAISDDDGVIVAFSTIAKTVLDTSFNQTDGSELNVGELVTFRILTVLPEVISTHIITDTLPDMPGVLEYVSSEVTFIGASLQGSNLNVGDEGVVNGQDIVFDFGTILNVADGQVTVDDGIAVTVTARVGNDPSTGNGDVLVNTATVDFGTGTETATSSVTVIEPLLTLEKELTPTTGDAGDSLDYTLTIEHDAASTGPAFDVVIQDPLLDDLLSLDVGSVTATIDGNPVRGLRIIEGNDSGDTTVLVQIPVLEVGETLVVSFAATVDQQVNFGDVVDNRATVDYDSSPLADTTDSRAGTQLSDAARFFSAEPTVMKEIDATDFDETVGTDVGVGETITYRLTLEVPQGVSNVVLEDALPAGLTYVSSRIVDISSGISTSTGVAIGDSGVNVGGLTTFDFGELTSLATLDQLTDSIVVEIVAIVDPTGPAAGGDRLTNFAALTYDNGTVTDFASVDVVTPLLNIDKSAAPTTADGGDTISYSVEVTHDAASDGPAYDLVIEDDTFLTEAALAFDGGSVVVLIDGLPAADAVVELGGDPADQALRVLVPVLNVGQTLTVSFTATVSADAPFASTITNTARANYDTSPSDDPADGRPLAEIDDDAAFTTPAPTISKTLTDPNDASLVVGELIEYTIEIVLPDGAGDVVVIDDLPTPANSGGLISFVSGEVVSIGAGIANSALIAGDAPLTADLFGGDGLFDRATFDFGSLNVIDDMATADYNTIVLQIVGLVEDVPANVRGDVFTNTATLEFSSRTGTQTVDDSVDATLTEPELLLDKVGSELAINPGDSVTYTLTLSHDGASDAPGRDIVLEDLLSDPFLDLDIGSVAVVVNGGGASGTPVIVTGNGAGDTGILITLDTLDVGDEMIVTYSATLNGTAPEANSFINTATADYDSLPGVGGRPDVAEGVYRVATVPAIFKTIESTEFAETGSSQGDPGIEDVALGEEISFRYELFLPEVVSNDVLFTDQLPILDAGTLTITDVEIVEVGASLDISGPGAGGAPTITFDPVTGAVSIDFGSVDNNVIDLIVNEDDRIVIRVTAVADGAAAENVAGAVSTNMAALSIDVAGNILTADDQVSVEIVEPTLAIEKTVTPTNADAGDTLSYELRVTHDAASSGPAYDVVISDPLLATLNLTTGSVTTTAGVVTTGNGGGDGAVRVDIPVLDVGETAVIRFDVVLGDDTPFNSTQTNTATLDYDSDPEENGDERQYAQESASSDVTTPVPTISKAVLTTSISETPDGVIPALTVGETVTYRITIDMPEGSSPLVVSDALPSGLQYVSSTVASFNGAISTTGIGLGDSGVNSGASTTFDFGAVTVAGTPGDGNPSIEIELTAVVVDAGGPSAGDMLQNEATLTFNGGTDADTADVTIIEPELQITKDGPPAANPGDVGDYTVRVSHTGASTAAAFDVVIADPVSDPGLLLDATSVSVTIDGAAAPPGSLTITNTGGQTGFVVSLDTLLLGQELVIAYQAQLSPTAALASTFINTATLDYDSVGADDEIPGQPGRPGTDSDINTLGTGPSIEKSVVDSSFAETTGNELGIGELVTFRLDISVPETTIDDIVVIDQLPTGGAGVLSFVSANVDAALTGVALGAGVPTITTVDSNGDGFEDRITFDFGQIVNPAGDGLPGPEDRIVLEVVARVEDLPGANAGSVLVNEVGLNSNFNGVILGPQIDTAEVVLVEPSLTVEKTTPTVTADAGDEIVYTIVVDHGPGSTGPAYDVVLEDLVQDPGLDFVGGTASLTVAGVDRPDLLVSGGAAADTFGRAEIPVLELGQTAILTFTGRVTNAVLLGADVVNEVSVNYDSNPSDVPADGRIYDEETANAAVGTPVPDFAKSVFDTSFSETGSDRFSSSNPDVGIGEVVTYRFDVTLPEGTAPLLITDRLPTNGVFAFEGVQVTPGADMSGALLTTPTVNFTDSNGDGNPDLLVIDLGDVTNSGVNNGAAGADSLFVDAMFRIVDDPANMAGESFANFASLDFGTGVARDFALIDVVEPELEIEKTTPVTDADAGDLIPFTLEVTHSSTSSAAAYDVVIQDLLQDAGLALVSGGVTLTIDGVDRSDLIVDGQGAGDTVPRAEIPVLELGQIAILTFTAVVTDAVEFDGSIENTGTVDYDSDPSDDPADGRTYDTERSDVSIATPAPEFLKRVLSTSLPETGSEQLTPGIVDAAIGEVVTYRFAATLPEGTAPLIIQDQLPTNGAYEIESVTVSPRPNMTGADLADPTVTFTDTNGDGRPDLVTIDLGVVTNPGDDDGAGGDGALFVDVAIRILDAPGLSEGVALTNVATFDYGTGFLTDDAVVEIVEPDLSIDKTVDNETPFLGDILTFTVVARNAADATATAYNVVVSDPIPSGLIFIPNATQVAGAPSATVGASQTDLIVTIPSLAPGQQVTITYQAQVSFTATPNAELVNIASIDGNTAPDDAGRDLGPPPGAFPPAGSTPPAGAFDATDEIDDARVFTQFVSGGGSVFESRMGQIDDEDFRPLIQIDPIFSGSAAIGAQVVMSLIARDGSVMGVQSMVADAGGQWVIRFPMVQLFVFDEPFDEFYDRSRIFEDGTGLFNGMNDLILPMNDAPRTAFVGTAMEDATFTARMQVSGGDVALDKVSGFNARTYFAPAQVGQVQVSVDRFEIDDVFENLPENTLEALSAQADKPLQSGLNRFNYEFLAASAAVSN